jgi:hypothetical protein
VSGTNGTIVKFTSASTIGNSIMTESGSVITISGTLTETSSLRYKRSIVNLSGALETIMQLQGVSYKLKDSDVKEIGFIAEQIEQVLPEAVIYKDGKPDSVAYSRITAILVEALKEQQRQINELKEKLIN